MQLVRTLLIVFAISDSNSVVDRFGFAVAVSMFDKPWQDIIIAVADVETDIMRYEMSKSGACCFMQLLGGRYDNASCHALFKNTSQCIAEAAVHLAYWKIHCGRAWLDAWHGGFVKCIDGIWYEKNKDRTDVDWCSGAECYSYGDKVKRRLETIKDRVTKWR